MPGRLSLPQPSMRRLPYVAALPLLLLLLLGQCAADSLNLTQLTSPLSCGAVTFQAQLTYSASQPLSLFLYLSDVSASTAADADTLSNVYGAQSTTVAAGVNATIPVSLSLTTALPCQRSVQWTAVLSSSTDPTDNSSYTTTALQRTTTVGQPVLCFVTVGDLTTYPPLVSQPSFNLSLQVTVPGPARVTWWVSAFNGVHAQLQLQLNATVLALTQNLTWAWPTMSGAIPPSGTPLSLVAVASPLNPNSAWGCNVTAPFITAGINVWSDSIDYRSLPAVLLPLSTAPTASDSVHLDLFAGNTGRRQLRAQLVDSTGHVAYLNDSSALCDANPHPLSFSYGTAQLLSFDYHYTLNGAVWNSSVTSMYWLVQYLSCDFPQLQVSASTLVPVRQGALQDSLSAAYFSSPSPSNSTLTLFLLLTTNGSRVVDVWLWSPAAQVLRGTGSVVIASATAARIVPVTVQLQEGFLPLSADLQWTASMSAQPGNASLVNVSVWTQATAGVATYFDSFSWLPLTAGSLYGSALIDVQAADRVAGYTMVDVSFTLVSGGPRCVQLLVATLSLNGSANSGHRLLTVSEVFASLSFNTSGPQAAVNQSQWLMLNLTGSNGSALTAELPLLNLLGVVYNCWNQPLLPLLQAQQDVSPFLDSGALSLLPVDVSSAQDDIDTAGLNALSLTAYANASNVSVAASTSGARDLFVALISSEEGQIASGWVAIGGAQQLTGYTITLSFQQHPNTTTASYWVQCALLPAGAGSSASWPSSGSQAIFSASVVPAAVYAIQDAIHLSTLPRFLEPVADQPQVTLNLSTIAAQRQLLLLVVDTSQWSAAAIAGCSGPNGSLSSIATLAASNSSAAPASLSLSDGSNSTAVYGFYFMASVPQLTPLSAWRLTLSFVQPLPRQYSSLAWVSVLTDTLNLSSVVSSVQCRPVSSLNTIPPVNSIDGSPLPLVVPYLPLNGSGSGSNLSLPVSLRIGSAQPLAWQLQLMQVGRAAPLGSTSGVVSFVRQPTLYNSSVTLTSLPPVDHTDLYWSFWLLNATAGHGLGPAGRAAVAAAAAADSLDISGLPRTININASAVISGTAVLLPLQVTASTAATRWLYVRLVSSPSAQITAAQLYGLVSILIYGATGNRSHSVNLQLLQPIPAGSNLTLQVLLTAVAQSSSANNSILAWRSANVTLNGTLASPPVDAVDLTLLSTVTQLDCLASSVTVELNVSTAAARQLQVSLLDYTAGKQSIASLSIRSASYFQTRRLQLPLANGSSCSHLFAVQASLSATQGSAALVTATGPALTAVGTLDGQSDTAWPSSYPSPQPTFFTGSGTLTLRGGARLLFVHLVNADGSFSYGAAPRLLLAAPALQRSFAFSGVVSSALVGNSITRYAFIVTSTLVPSLAIDLTQPCSC